MWINKFISKLFWNKTQLDLRGISLYVERIKAVYQDIQKLSNDELRLRSKEINQKIADTVIIEKNKINELKSSIDALEMEEHEKVFSEIKFIEKAIFYKQELALNEVLPEIFAIVKDTARRFMENDQIIVTANDFDRQLADSHDFVSIDGDKAIYANQWSAGGTQIKWDMIHYDVQLFGGVVLHHNNSIKIGNNPEKMRRGKMMRGYIAEMATGEGKTLVATLPLFLNALTHNGVHVVTVNDYLSIRDSEWMGPLYMFHGLSVDCINKYEPNSDDRRKAYEADIIFGTQDEFGLDYLRDNMAISQKDLVQRKHYYAIVDEADSILIDEARTPLIISGSVSNRKDQLYEVYRSRVEHIVNTQKRLTIQLFLEAKQKMDSSDPEEQKKGFLLLFCVFKGMPKNKSLIKFLSNEQGIKANILKQEESYLLMQNDEKRVFTDPLYFIIDENKNTIELTDRGIELLNEKSDDPQYFVLPDIGIQIAQIENEELSDFERQAKKDELEQDYSVKLERIQTVNQLLKAYCLFEKDCEYVVVDNEVKLVDEQTGRIMEGRRYSDGLHQAIEAKEHVQIADATQTNASITLQNYFRLYRKLAGMTATAETEADEFRNVYKLDVVVIPTNRPIARNDFNDRIYKTKREKYNAIISEISNLIKAGRPVLVGTTSVEISELLSRILQKCRINHNVLNAKFHQREAEIVAQAGQSGNVTIAANMAGRGTDIKLSPAAKEAGGLAIIGTERHESRRIDRQLRGRAGRQGDPGSSVFFISLEDDLMRKFASEKIAKLMERMGFEDGDVLEANMLNKSVERAQKKVENNNFDIRKILLEYDDVMNSQREVIYTRRRHALTSERITLDIYNMLNETVYAIVEQYFEELDYEGLKLELIKTLAIEIPFTEIEMKGMKPAMANKKIFNEAMKKLKYKTGIIELTAYPVIKNLYENQGNLYENILIPITDGLKMYNISCNLRAAFELKSKTVATSFQKSIIINTIDEVWKEHLREMDELRESVQMARYENKDPLLAYKQDSFDLFTKIVDDINRKVFSVLMRGQIPTHEQKKVLEEGNEWKEKGDFTKAIECYDRAIKSNPNDDIAWNRKGNCLFSMKQYNEAIACYDEAININKKVFDHWDSKIECLFEMQHHDEVISCYDDAINIFSDFYLNKKGKYFCSLKRYAEAIICFDQAIFINPNDSTYWDNKVECLIEMQKHEEVIECYKQEMEINTDDNYYWYKKGENLFYVKRYKEALLCFNQAIIINPNDRDNWDMKVNCLLEMQQHEEVIECFNEAIRIHPGNDYYYLKKGEYFHNKQQYEEALICFDYALILNPNNEYYWEKKAYCLFNMQKYEEALACYDEAITANSDVSASFWKGKGNILSNLQRFEDSIECFSKAIELDENDDIAWNNKGYSLIEIRDYEAAVDAFNQSIEIYYNLNSIFHLLFLYRDKLGETNIAIELFNSLNEEDIENDENKDFIYIFYMHKTLFELYEKNEDTAKKYLMQTFELIEKENQLSFMTDDNWWLKVSSVIIKLGYGSWLLEILEEKGYDIVLSTFYISVQTLILEQQNLNNEQKEANYVNEKIEINESIKLIIEKIRKYM